MSAIRLLPAANTLASLAIDGPAAATFNTVVEAVPAYEGPAGNAITLALAATATWEACVGTLTLTGNPTNAKASLDLDATLTTHCDTIIENAVAGAVGNLTTIAFAAGSTVDEGEYDESAFPAITFTFKTGVTTVADFEAAVTASTRLDVKTAGTGANVLAVADDDFAATALAGGTNTQVTIGSTVYNFVTTATTTANDVEISAVNASATIDNLIAAINLAAGSGTVYGSATVEHPTVRAFTGAGDTMVVHSKPDVLAAAGTLLATTVSGVSAGVTSLFPGSWAAATLADGTDGDNVVFAVSGTDIACEFADGFSCVEDFEAAIAADAAVAALIRVKTAGTTPLYQMVVTDDDFSATNLTGGGATSAAMPTLTDTTAGKQVDVTGDYVTCFVRNVDTATSTTKTITATLVGFHAQSGRWYVVKALNGGSAIAETTSDAINYAETVLASRRFNRYACILSVAGAGTEAEVWVDVLPVHD